MTTTTTASKTFQPSHYQQAIFDALAVPGGDIQVNAVAGSGKTTTLIEGLRRQPADLLDSTLLCAFSREIKATLEKKVAKISRGADVSTIHGIGFKTLQKYFRWPARFDGLDDRKYHRLIAEYWKTYNPTPEDEKGEAEAAMHKLVHFARVCLVNPTDLGAVEQMVTEREIELPFPEPMIAALRTILDWGIDGLPRADRDGNTYCAEECIDYDDMLWLPWVLKLQPRRYRLVLVDECQDLSAAQLDLVLKCREDGGRMLFVGDPRQAIYAFAGADAASFDNITWRTKAELLPLSVCYRCSRAVIDLAQTLVPEIECGPNAPAGAVQEIKAATFMAEVLGQDMVLCRVNAPLISTAFALIRMGKPAKVRGRDIGASLVKIVDAVEKLRGYEFEQFVAFAEIYRRNQLLVLGQKKDSEMLQASLNDRVDSAIAVYERAIEDGARNAGDLRATIRALFADNENGHILLSSIHKAKGLEAERVFLLCPEKLPHPMARTAAQREQEENLKYVAYTRAMSELFIVQTDPEVRA